MPSSGRNKIAYLSLGSNIEPRREHLVAALQGLEKVGEVISVASLYESDPYGYLPQPQFFNTACLLRTSLPPPELLCRLKQIEQALGRIPRVRWGPREIDLDIVFYEHQMLRLPELILPHPDYLNRPFVLWPLAELAPEFVPPDHTRTLLALAEECGSTGLRLIEKHWFGYALQL